MAFLWLQTHILRGAAVFPAIHALQGSSCGKVSCLQHCSSSKREWLVFGNNTMQHPTCFLFTSIVMRRSLAILGLALSIVTIGTLRPSHAESVRSVFELFTSQGCSSCPPADRLAGELAAEPGVLLLSFPVDYWDYLGWKDTLAHSAFGKRQKLYAKTRRDRQVYTPQMVINGMSHVVGSDRDAITAAEIAAGSLPVAMRILRKDGRLMVDVPAGAAERKAALLLFPVQGTRAVEIGRGENSGAMVTYTNVVRGLTRVGDWNGAAMQVALPEAALKGENGDADGFVIVLQSMDDSYLGPILGAVRGSGF
jgi:hypothetical protein